MNKKYYYYYDSGHDSRQCIKFVSAYKELYVLQNANNVREH